MQIDHVATRDVRWLRAIAPIATVAGAGGSLALMLYAGRHNASRLLLVIFTIWVLAPFVAAALANSISTRWSPPVRATLRAVMLVMALGSLVVYAHDAVRPRTAQAAFVYVIVPLASWIMLVTVVPLVALVSRRRTPRHTAA